MINAAIRISAASFQGSSYIFLPPLIYRKTVQPYAVLSQGFSPLFLSDFGSCLAFLKVVQEFPQRQKGWKLSAENEVNPSRGSPQLAQVAQRTLHPMGGGPREARRSSNYVHHIDTLSHRLALHQMSKYICLLLCLF